MAGYIKKIARYLKKKRFTVRRPQSAHSCIVVDFLTQNNHGLAPEKLIFFNHCAGG